MKRFLSFAGIIFVISILWSLPEICMAENLRPITAWPLLYHRSDKEESQTDILWPLFHHEREDERTNYSLRPFLFSTEKDLKADSRKISLLWPLTGYKRKGPDLSLHIFPVYWYKRYPDIRHNIIFPVYWEGEREDDTFLHLWPLFGTSHQGQNYTEYSTLYPFFRYGHDKESDEMDLHAPWPLINFYYKDDYYSRSFLPFYWAEGGTDYNGGFIFPFYWRKAPEYLANGVFPFWYSARGPELKTHFLLPFYFNQEKPKEHLRLITPFYLDKGWGDVRLRSLIPFYLNYETEKSDLKLFIPLYGKRKTEESTVSTIIPFYLNYEKEDMGIKLILPTYAGYKAGKFHFSSLFPVYYHSEDGQNQSELTYYFPLYGRYQRGDSMTRHLIFFPLYSKLEDNDLKLKARDIIWPLFHYEKSPDTLSLRILPFYWRTRTKNYGLTMFFPFFWALNQGENKYMHLLPFYGVHTKGDWYTKRFILGPLFITTQDTKNNISGQDILFPLYSRRKEGDHGRSWLIPFYYHKYEQDEQFILGSMALLPPYYFNRQKENGDEIFHLWPFFSKLRIGSYKEYSTLWPLFRLGNDPENDIKLTHLLLYYHKSEREKSFSAFFPLWRHEETPQLINDKSLLLHWYKNDLENKEKDLSLLWLFPLDVSLIRYQQKPNRLRHRIFPIYSYDHNESTDALHLNFLWPLFFYGRRGEFYQQTGFLWKIISYERKNKESSEFRFLWRFIRNYKTQKAYTFEFNPLYYYESEEGNKTYWAILGGLFGVESIRDQPVKIRFLWFL